MALCLLFRYQNAMVKISLNTAKSYEDLFKLVPFLASDTSYISCNVILRPEFSKMDINFEVIYYTTYFFVAEHPMYMRHMTFTKQAHGF